MADREDVIVFLRKMTDAYLAQAADTGVEPWQLFTLLHNSAVHAVGSLDRSAARLRSGMQARAGDAATLDLVVEQLSEPEHEEEVLLLLSPVIDAAIQLAVAGFLMLETLPLPPADELMLNFLPLKPPKEKPN